MAQFRVIDRQRKHHNFIDRVQAERLARRIARDLPGNNYDAKWPIYDRATQEYFTVKAYNCDHARCVANARKMGVPASWAHTPETYLSM